jgi:hypothetical protein
MKSGSVDLVYAIKEDASEPEDEITGCNQGVDETVLSVDHAKNAKNKANYGPAVSYKRTA